MLGQPNDSISRQDIKDVIARSQSVLKVAGKYKMALWTLAGVMQDMSESVIDLSRCRAVKQAERIRGGVKPDGLKRCGELHLTMSKRIRELGDRVQRELEDPLQKGIEEHANTVVANEKRLAYMGKEIQDKIKKAETDTRKRRNRNPEQIQQAVRNLAQYTAELQDLKYVNQNVILGEEARNIRSMEAQWSTLLRSLAILFGQCVAGAAGCADELSEDQKSDANAILTETVFSASKRNNSIKTSDGPSRRVSRRGSLDSNIGPDQRHHEEAMKSASFGRAVAQLAGAVAAATIGAPERQDSSLTANDTTEPASSGTAAEEAASNSSAPQLSLPAFSRLGNENDAPSPKEQSPTVTTPSSQFPPRPIIKSNNSSSTIEREKRRVAFPTSKPIATVRSSVIEPTTSQNLTSTLSSLYPDIFAAENTQIASVPVSRHGGNLRTPAVYVAGGDGDAESQMGSVVGASESLVGVMSSTKAADLVYAIHDFTARSAKEMSLTKGDVIEVRKRQGTWIYGTKLQRKKKDGTDKPMSPSVESPSSSRGFADRFRRGPPQQQQPQADSPPEIKPEVGWIPMAFVAKFSAV
ncbi:uncharacterized protein SPPG_04170 [Spizellomyces punctatus DAOM BR117]|uniref:SH3 domain-containing protein n=1 Tax=Spizellomyces punctatus (strain DAOM BR117) TaxID=645134 RepID=A0A0L0HJ91_SPIPD|nr:uncharacterized protein SPPG_04170 [Spizellomyces punctatus DAOM BR117]KND01078.1 hypothetical protein SPPG_04170 [Spizellomyces punctatus DAOM BR117]|eukprot:XP_016609117.1 hypothetical protein SPPG_04170 [Spizellomyces punctatus DAOM BR117]